MKGKRREFESSNSLFPSPLLFFISSLFLSFFLAPRRSERSPFRNFRTQTRTHAARVESRKLSWGRRCSEGEGGGQHGLVCWNANWDGRGGRGGPRPSRKFPRPARFRCPVHIITVLRIPAPEIVRALVALRALLSRFLPVFFTPPSPGLPAKLPHQRRIIVVHTGIRIIRAGFDDGYRRMRLAPRMESAWEKSK